MLFPNLCLTSFPGNFAVIEVVPRSAERTFERLQVYATDQVVNNPTHEVTRKQILDFSVALFEETLHKERDL